MSARKPFVVPALAGVLGFRLRANAAQSRTENKNLVSDKALAFGSDHAGNAGLRRAAQIRPLNSTKS